ncbi:MAG: hypothetical protein PHF18_13085 [Methanosarcina sp.]|nr:hypothetical protein [Methanosarcina sp.]
MLYTEIHGDTLKKVLRKAYTTGIIRWDALKNVFTLEELLKNVIVFFTYIFTGAAVVLDGKKTERRQNTIIFRTPKGSFLISFTYQDKQ